MIWNKVERNHTTTQFFKFQNRSLIVDSKVYIKVGDNKPTSLDGAILITSRQFINMVIKPEENIWTCGLDGGLATYTSTDMPNLVNYNIPTSMHTVDISNKPIQIEVPEGGTLIFQNLTDSNIGAKMGEGEGSFILSKYQVYSESYPRKTLVTFIPNINNTPSRITYCITQSAIITQISTELREELNSMKASVDLIMKEAVTEDAITAVTARTYHGTWSAPSFIQKSNTKILMSYPFLCNSKTYHSENIKDNSEFNVIYDIAVTYSLNGQVKNERGMLFVKGIYKSSGTGSTVISRCTNLNIAKLVESITLNVSSLRNEICVGVLLKDTVLTSSMMTMVKIEYNFMEPLSVAITDTEYITSYSVDIVNSSIDVADDFIEKSLKLIGRLQSKSTTLPYKVISVAKSSEDINSKLVDVYTYTLSNNTTLVVKVGSDLGRTIVTMPKLAIDSIYISTSILTLIRSDKHIKTLNMTIVSNDGEITSDNVNRTINTTYEPSITSLLNELVGVGVIAVGDVLEISFREGVR